MTKWLPWRPNHVTNRFRNARNRFRRPNLVGKDTFHAKNVSLIILTNFSAVLNNRGGYRPLRDENRGAASQIAQNGPGNNCAKWHLSNTNSRFFLCVPPRLTLPVMSRLGWGSRLKSDPRLNAAGSLIKPARVLRIWPDSSPATEPLRGPTQPHSDELRVRR